MLKFKQKNLKNSTFLLGFLLFGVLFPFNVYAKSENDQIVALDGKCVLATNEIQNLGAEILSENIVLLDQSEQKVLDELKSKNCVEGVVQNKKISLASLSSEPLYSQQWYLNNTGQTVQGVTGVSDVDIDYPEAYQKFDYDRSTVVAVIDTGVTSNSELSGRVLGGYNFVASNTDTADNHGHGTFIAGIIGADSRNNFGIVGINDNVRILPIKVLDGSGNGYLSDLIKGIDYAVDKGAHIINMSLVADFSSEIDSVLNKAYTRGVVMVAAAGNEGKNLDTSPRTPISNIGVKNWVIGVGSIDSNGNRSNFSNYGSMVDIYAPGSTMVGVSRSNTFEVREGTSIASAVVTGVVAAWRDYYGSLSPDEAISFLNTYKDGTRINLNNALVARTWPNGTLVKSLSTGVYLLKQGFRRPIIRPEIFLSYNYKWDEIITITDYELSQIPEGPALYMRDGMLIADQNTVYVIEYGYKRPFGSADVFLSRGYRWENVTFPHSAVLRLHPTGEMVGYGSDVLSGSVIYSDVDGGAYMVENGIKRLMSNPYIYESYYKWSELIKVPPAIFNGLGSGGLVLPREGSLIADRDKVYIVENGSKKPFGSPNAFLSRGYQWKHIAFPPQYVLDLLPTGAIIN
jgi:GTP:adenosylcobinamide-phosphate guanylyltransferase